MAAIEVGVVSGLRLSILPSTSHQLIGKRLPATVLLLRRSQRFVWSECFSERMKCLRRGKEEKIEFGSWKICCSNYAVIWFMLYGLMVKLNFG